jgi:hypothetical protein
MMHFTPIPPRSAERLRPPRGTSGHGRRNSRVSIVVVDAAGGTNMGRVVVCSVVVVVVLTGSGPQPARMAISAMPGARRKYDVVAIIG